MGIGNAIEHPGAHGHDTQGRRSRRRHRLAGPRSRRSSYADAQHRAAKGWVQVERNLPITRAIAGAVFAGSLFASAPLFSQGFGAPIMDITGHWATRQHEDQEE